jgi:hypothetical protein
MSPNPLPIVPSRLIAYLVESPKLVEEPTMKTGLLTLEASFRTSVEDRARAKALKTAIVLETALMMFIATIGLNAWLAFH